MMVRFGLLRGFSLLVLAALLVGCGSSIGDRIGNFRAYYNTFYNAEQAYRNAVEDLSLENEEISQSRFVPLRPSPAQVTQDNLLEDAVTKSADILRDHNDTRWVYPALLLIGKAYFYQENYAGAEQNFREIIERDESRRPEAHAWLARTMLEAGRYDDALDHVTEHRNQVNQQYRADLELTAAQIHVRKANWRAASASLVRALEEQLDRLTRAHALILLGQVREAQYLHLDASQAYEQARQLRASDPSSFHALIGEARARTHAGQYSRAAQLLADARREQRYPNQEAAIRFWDGYLATIIDEHEQAVAQWHQLLEDSDSIIPSHIRSRMHHALGEVYRDHYQDYTQAAAHFESAAAATDTGDEGSPWLTTFAVTGSRIHADRFAEVAEATNRMNRLDSLLALGELDDASYAAFVEETRDARMQELEEARQSASPDDQWEMAGVQTQGAASTEDAASAAGDAGFLFYRNPARVQEIQTRFVTQWGDRPHVRNWRRQEAVTAVAQTPAGVIDDMLIDEEQSQDVRTMTGDLGLSDVPRDADSRNAMRRELAEAQYQLGNALFLSIERPDSALYWYETVIESEHAESISLQARYAMAEAYSAMERSEMATPLYEEVAAQDERPDLARRAAERLGQIDADDDDISTTAEDRYQEAYANWEIGNRPEALEDMLGIYTDYPGAPAAPRSLLAAGHVSIEMAQHREVPQSQASQWIPDSLRTHSPDTLASVDQLVGLAHAIWEELANTYPDSRHAKRAAHLTEALDQPHRKMYLAQRLRFGDAAPDLSLEQLAISQSDEELPEDAADSPPGQQSPAQSGSVSSEDAALSTITGNELVGDSPINNELGGWTIVVGSDTSQSSVEAEVDYWRSEGFRTAILPYEAQSESGFRVAVGQIATLRRAHDILDQQSERLPDHSWVLQLGESSQQAEAESALLDESVGDPAPDEPAGQVARDQNLPEEEGQAIPAEGIELTGDAPVESDQGGWTIVVGTGFTRANVEPELQVWREAGYRAGIIPFTTDDGEEGYGVAVGQIATYSRAQELLEQNERAFPADSWLLNLSSERN